MCFVSRKIKGLLCLLRVWIGLQKTGPGVLQGGKEAGTVAWPEMMDLGLGGGKGQGEKLMEDLGHFL